MPTRWISPCALLAALMLLTGGVAIPAADMQFASHPPMRPLPAPADRPLASGPHFFVDAAKGDDQHDGSKQKPFRTLARAIQGLKPGDTVCLRGGVYHESVTLALAGTAQQPITLRAYPGELAVVDAGLREFTAAPAAAWEPAPGGAPAEFRSVNVFHSGGGFGNFADSMIPFHRYMNFHDLRSGNELYRPELNNRQDDPVGIYCGPGVRRDPQTGRIHVRLAHTQLEGLGSHAYRGETDPRKLPLVISGHDYALRIEGARHLRIQDIVVRGAERSAILITRDEEDISQHAEDIELDGVTLYGSGSALRVSHTRRLKLLRSCLRGHSAPWHSRFTVKNRAGSGYLVVAEGSDFEVAYCELTDHHDCFLFHGVDGLTFHHNLVDNFNDDGLEPGPKKERGTTLVYENFISRTLNPFTAHGGMPVPVDAAPGSGLFVFRNVVDLRHGTYTGPPREADPTGEYLNGPTTLICHDHGSPVHAVYYVYHNTFLLPGDAFRDYYALTWSGHTRGTTRRVFNNIFVQAEGLPGLNFTGLAQDDDFQADGNLLWGIQDGPSRAQDRSLGDYFLEFQKSPLFAASKERYPPGWTANDRFADPRFVLLANSTGPRDSDFRLQPSSPAIDAGVAIPADWPDTLRQSDTGKPDIGAFPLDAKRLIVGPAASP